jgi:hypothetical protein
MKQMDIFYIIDVVVAIILVAGLQVRNLHFLKLLKWRGSPLRERPTMFFPWYTILMLGLESNRVIGLRLMKLAGGARAAQDEARLMLSEKVNASFEAGAVLMQGGGVLSVVDRYREHVAENSDRLSPV